MVNLCVKYECAFVCNECLNRRAVNSTFKCVLCLCTVDVFACMTECMYYSGDGGGRRRAEKEVTERWGREEGRRESVIAGGG